MHTTTTAMAAEAVHAVLRRRVYHADVPAVRAVADSTGFFTLEEARMAQDLVRERLFRGEASGYRFVFAELPGQQAAFGPDGRDASPLAGFACFGPIDCAPGRFDLYWLAVRGDLRGRGLGTRLLAAAEEDMLREGARRVYAETSSTPRYEPTRAFYEARGFRVEARLRDFYAPDDDKVFYVKEFGPEPAGG